MSVPARPLSDDQAAALCALAQIGSWCPRDRVWAYGTVAGTWRLFDGLAMRGLVRRREAVHGGPIFTVTDGGRDALRVIAEIAVVDAHRPGVTLPADETVGEAP